MKKLGRNKRPFFRICAIDSRAPRDGKVIEELGHYDPLVKDTDARAILNGERIAYWLSVGAQPSENVAILIKKYGTNGTHVAAQKSALEKLAQPKSVPDPGAPASLPQPKLTKAEAEAAAKAEAEAAVAAETKPEQAEAKTEESPPAPAEEAPAQEAVPEGA
jgi:small subunit ribosomal protein S16